MNKQGLKILITSLTVSMLYACSNGVSTDIILAGPNQSRVATETVSYDITDFSELTVGGPFNVSILQGSEFLVEITIDHDDVNSLNIEKTGPALNIGFHSGVNVEVETLEAVVVMPSLVRVSLAGASNAMFSGFSGSALNIEMAGAAVLDGLNVGYDIVVASAVGASRLTMIDVLAIPTAHADLVGASTATFNLMESAVLTGSITAASSLFYYGNNVVIGVNTDQSSSVQRLGETQDD